MTCEGGRQDRMGDIWVDLPRHGAYMSRSAEGADQAVHWRNNIDAKHLDCGPEDNGTNNKRTGTPVSG